MLVNCNIIFLRKKYQGKAKINQFKIPENQVNFMMKFKAKFIIFFYFATMCFTGVISQYSKHHNDA